MIAIGEYQLLTVIREVDFGLYLGDGEHEVLLPKKYIPHGLSTGDKLRVFVYRDSEDRPVATTLRPAAAVNEFACMEVKDLTDHGAFMDWGLEKDLFVPKREQHKPFRRGEFHIIRVLMDHRTQRLIGSSKIRAFLEKDTSGLEEGMAVQLMIWETTDLGYKAIIDGKYEGLLYREEAGELLKTGDTLDGYIYRLREDGKIDLRLNMGGKEGADTNRDKLLNVLYQQNGWLALTDKSSPEEIYETLKMSKKAFKKALGNLYREKLVVLEDEGIRLAEN